ncbi:MAG: hypothetical protein K8I27_07330 [Planctomycetes bacterium]|nr:hypothetical protein [Planctomycetota bacterium]
MKRILLMLVGVCALGGTVFTTGCGPGLVAAGGGSVGAIFGFSGNDDDGKKDGGGSTTPTTNVVPAVIVTALQREVSPATISYTIIDANNDPCSVDVQYAVGTGAFQPCFEGGGDGTTALGSSAGGTPHVFDWDFAADLGPDVTQDITIRIRADDGQGAGSWAMLTNQIAGNEAPSISGVQATGTDVVLIGFNLTDLNSDLASIDVKYSIDQGQNFIPVDTDPLSPTYELLGNPPVNMLTSSTGSPGQFIWASQLSLSDFVGEVRIQLTPRDRPSGYSSDTVGPPVVAGPFPIDNSINAPPQLSLLDSYDGQTFTGRVPINITLADDESDAAIVQVLYSIDGGANFLPATLVNQFVPSIAGPFLTNPSPTPYQIIWDALADFGSAVTETNVVLVLRPRDSNDGLFTPTDSFTVIGNAPPDVVSVDILQDSGNVPVVFKVFDENSHPVSLEIEFTTDINAGTVVWTALDAADFVFGDPGNVVSSPFGADNVLVWDTNLAFPSINEAAVVLRVRPTDDPLGGIVPAQLAGAYFITSAFPIINNAAGATPISIDIFTTNDARVPTDIVTVTPGGTVYLDHLINPSSAVGFETFWKILETGADYGTLLDPATGLGLQYATGSVTVNVPGLITDGDTFTIDDGLNGPQAFEFDFNGLTGGLTTVVYIGAAGNADDTGTALADAINGNPLVRITATHTSGGVVNLQHQIACKLGNEVSLDPVRHLAQPMVFSGTAGTVSNQMDFGVGTDWVRYDAPAVVPAGSEYVTLYCEIDHPLYWTTVRHYHTLYWGDQPTLIDIQSPVPETLVATQVQLTSQVTPTTAPQQVNWVVVNGSAYGTISPTGLYTAPSVVPPGGSAEIRGFCVDPTIPYDWVSINIQPYPTGVTIAPDPNNPPAWNDPDLALGSSLQFTPTVTPGNAPSGVNWRIIWGGADQGSGNSTVGNVNSFGFYTAPATLPSPDIVRIEAVSQVQASVFGGYSIKLVAPPPTSFAVSPPSAVVYAGGAGQQFTTGTFVPSNANTSVTWEMSPVSGPTTGNISQFGFYTPPLTSSTAQSIIITARSAVAPTVTASATISLQPNATLPPTGVTITPSEGVTISAAQSSQPIQFTAVVSPPQASQAVTWSFFSTPFGTINPTSGLYVPAPTSTDRLVTIQATANDSPNPTAFVDVYISGDGHSWQETSNLTMGRGDASAVWDPFNDRVWFVGGRSETARVVHDEAALWVDITSAPEFGVYEEVSKSTVLPKSSNCIMCISDEVNDRLLAFIGQGAFDPVEVYELDLTGAASASPPAWTKLSPGSTSKAPKLSGTTRFHTWWDFGREEAVILKDKTTAYIYDTDADEWKTPETTQDQSLAPADVSLVAHCYDDSNNRSYFIGAADGTTSAINQVWELRESDYKWRLLTSTGSFPTVGIRNGSCYWNSGKIYLFGGRVSNQTNYDSNLFRIDISGTAAWTVFTPTAERPAPRGDAAFIKTGFGDVYLYGGQLESGETFGDLWWFDEGGTNEFFPENAIDIRPQGRKSACGTMDNGIGVIYGGLCDYGPSNELWTLDTFGTNPVWERKSASGALPPPLWGSAMTFDELNSVCVMFGGDKGAPGSGNAGLENRVWAFDTSTDVWTLLSPGGTLPSPRRDAAIYWDETNERIWMFGGVDASGAKNDLWYLDVSAGLPGTWQQITGTGGSAPDARYGATIGYDSRKNRVLVCGGHSVVSGSNRQIYSFSLSSSSWTALSVANTGQEEDVNASAGFFDDEYSRIVHAPATRKRLQAIVLGTNGPTWQYMTPPPVANNTTGATGLYDKSTGQYYVLFGERTILSRAVGTNVLRTVEFK